MEDKRAFFEALDNLDCLSDEPEDQETEKLARAIARSRKGKEPELESSVASSYTLTSTLNPQTSAPASTTLPRTRSSTGSQSPVQENVVSSSHRRSDSASSDNRGAPAARESSTDRPETEQTKVSMPPSKGNKRKRQALPAIVVPEHRQIFRGLNFCK